jgi:hypothetical protein
MSKARDIADRTLDGTDLTLGDNDKAVFGAGSDLQIYHEATSGYSIIKEAGQGNLLLTTNGAEVQILGQGGADYSARFIQDGAVNLYYDGAKKLATTSTGVDITGDLNVSGSIAGAGKVLQVVSTFVPTTQLITGSSYVAVNDLIANITPSSASSKILVTVHVHYSGSTNSYPSFRLIRNGTWIAQPNAGSGGETTFGHSVNFNSSEYRVFSAHYTYLDSPNTTSQVSYSIQARPMATSSQSIYINRALNIGDDNQLRATSTITAMEIAP